MLPDEEQNLSFDAEGSADHKEAVFEFSDDAMESLSAALSKSDKEAVFEFSDDAMESLSAALNKSDKEIEFNFSSDEFSELLAALECTLDELKFPHKRASSTPESIPPPDPNLSSEDVVNWMLQEVQRKTILYHSQAVRHIDRYFGEKFIYRNNNNNFAISKEVLLIFRNRSFATVVWNKRKRFWRLRRVDDPPEKRQVDS